MDKIIISRQIPGCANILLNTSSFFARERIKFLFPTVHKKIVYFKTWKKNLPCRRRSDDSTWLCRPDLSWAARLVAPEATPCRPNRGYADDRYRLPSIRTASQPRAARHRSRPAAAEPFPWASCPRAHRPPVTATAPGCDCWPHHRRGSTMSCHLSMSATKLYMLDNSSDGWFIFIDRCL